MEGRCKQRAKELGYTEQWNCEELTLMETMNKGIWWNDEIAVDKKRCIYCCKN